MDPRDADGIESSGRHLVLGAAILMIAVHLGFRAWALYPSWFFTDDYRLMAGARGHLTWSYLTEPFDSQFMPLGRLEVWAVFHSGTTNWALAATFTLVWVAAAALACLWALVTLFGTRPAVLALLAVYLTTAVILPGTMWWAAALNQLPLQVAIFLSVGAWVRYLRGDGRRWLWVTAVVLGVGLLAYVKVILLPPVLAAIALGGFTTGSPRQRVAMALRRWWPLLPLVLPFVAFTVFYRLTVPQPFDNAGQYAGQQALGALDGMLATSLPTGVLGGPWRWFNTSPPTVLVGAPGWTVHLSWVVAAFAICYAGLRRRRTAWGWSIAAGYALVAYVLLATSRGQLFGRVAGLEYRYLTDVLPVVLLAVGLVFLDVPGAPGSSEARTEPLLTRPLPGWLVAGFVAVISLGGLVSSWQYVDFWHHDNAGRDYVKTLQKDLDNRGPLDLADGLVPAAVMPSYTQPNNRVELFVPLVSDRARFPEVSDNLQVVTDSGSIQPAQVADGIASLPGPDPGCGWKIQGGRVDVPLEQTAFDYTWWIQVGYLGSADDRVTVEAGGQVFTAPVHRGLNTLHVRVTGEIASVAFSGLQTATLCVDQIVVGSVSARGAV